MEAILEKIKEYRKEKEYSYENMAYVLNISPTAYRKIELNQTKLSVERLYKIAEFLEVSVGDILDITPSSQLNQVNRDNSTGYLQKIDAFYQENKEKSDKIESLYEERLKDNEFIIEHLTRTIELLSK